MASNIFLQIIFLPPCFTDTAYYTPIWADFQRIYHFAGRPLCRPALHLFLYRFSPCRLHRSSHFFFIGLRHFGDPRLLLFIYRSSPCRLHRSSHLFFIGLRHFGDPRLPSACRCMYRALLQLTSQKTQYNSEIVQAFDHGIWIVLLRSVLAGLLFFVLRAC